MKPVDRVLKHLPRVAKRNGGWQALCPAHEDHEPSLSIREGADDRVLLKCFADCPTEAVVAALGLQMSDLFAESDDRREDYAKVPTVWQIKDTEGKVQAEHVRFDQNGGKECLWRLPGTDTWGLRGRKPSTLPLYGSERAKDWPEDVPVVVVAEGEPATDALRAVGFCALGTVTGANGTPGPEALEVLRGRRVVLWCDNDEPGRVHMRRLAEALEGIASEVRVFEWAEAPRRGDDAADHPAIKSKNPKALDKLLTDLEDAPRWEEGVTASHVPNGSVTPVTPLRFSEMDPPGPREYDVEDLVPESHVTCLFGDGGAAKSILALSAGTAVAGGADEWLGRKVRNCPVLYIDFELDADEQHRRAYQVARGAYLEKPPRDLLYVSGLGHPATEVLEGCFEVCVEHEVGLAIIDSMGIALEGEAESARDVIRFHREHLAPFRQAGITLLVIDHQSKTQSGERYQSKRTFGSVYKENLARSVIQVEPGNRGEDLLMLKLRQTKHNFGPKAAPFGCRLRFTEKQITVEEHALNATDLAEETTLNASDRVLLTLRDGPMYPADIAEASGIPLGTVKNELTKHRKCGLIEYTGREHPVTRAKEVRLTPDGRSVTPVTPTIGERDSVTPDEGSEDSSSEANHKAVSGISHNHRVDRAPSTEADESLALDGDDPLSEDDPGVDF